MNKKSSNSYKMSNMSQTPLVAIVGQTASGKSAIAMQLAKEFNAEIIAADSWTVRKQLDIGTAKPSAGDRQSVGHHLIDIVEPCEDFTAVEFQRSAKTAIKDIASRGKLPLLVGGTGLYVDSILYDYSFSRKGSSKERERYNAMTIDELLKEATGRNLNTSIIDVRNKRRIIRLLETNGAVPQRRPLRPNTLVLGVKIPKQQLESAIKQRVNQMIRSGLETEVRKLCEKYGWECEGLKGIGYIEWRDFLDGDQTLEQTKQRIIQSTRQLAKRQHTWFKRSQDINWCSSYEQVQHKMCTFLNQN